MARPGRKAKTGRGIYRKFKGEEFYSDGTIFRSRKRAEKYVELIKRDVLRVNPRFNFRYRILKTEGGYLVFTNNTVRNMGGR